MSTRDHPDWWKNVGGQNSQDSILERRSLIWNDNEIEDGTIPDDFNTNDNYEGKFFPRGCRGMLESIQVYCLGNAVDTLTLRYSPHPCIGPYGEVSIIPAAGWAWQDFPIEEMWNYDGLFIWFLTSTVNLSWAYDAELPYDGHHSTDVGATWSDTETRPFIRAIMTGETPGDVPVSGTLNVVEIPSVGTRVTNRAGVASVHDAETVSAAAFGAGTLLEVRVTFMTSVAPTAGAAPAAVLYEIRVYSDGDLAYLISNRVLTQSCVAVTGRCAVGEFFQCTIEQDSWDRTVMTLRLPIKFRRAMQIGVYQSSGANTTFDLMVTANMVR